MTLKNNASLNLKAREILALLRAPIDAVVQGILREQQLSESVFMVTRA
jgi:hypothetical protein